MFLPPFYDSLHEFFLRTFTADVFAPTIRGFPLPHETLARLVHISCWQFHDGDAELPIPSSDTHMDA